MLTGDLRNSLARFKHPSAPGRTGQLLLSDYQEGAVGPAQVHVSKQKDEMCRDFRTSEANNHTVCEAGKTLVIRGNKKDFSAAVLETNSWSHAREGRNVFIV